MKNQPIPKYVADALVEAHLALIELAPAAGHDPYWNRGGQGYKAYTRVVMARRRLEQAGKWPSPD